MESKLKDMNGLHVGAAIENLDTRMMSMEVAVESLRATRSENIEENKQILK